MSSGIDGRMNCTAAFKNNVLKSGAGNVPRTATAPVNAFAVNHSDTGKAPQFAAIFNANQPKTPTDWLQSTLGPGRLLNQTA